MAEALRSRKRLKQNGRETDIAGIIAVLFGNSALHNAGVVEDDWLQDKDFYLDFEDVSEDEENLEMDENVEKTVPNGLSDAEVAWLK